MERIGSLVTTITTASAEERLRASAQVGLAIAIFLSDIESSQDVAVVITMIEQAIVSIASHGHGLALNNLRDIGTALESFHCRACRLYCIYKALFGRLDCRAPSRPTIISAPAIGRTQKCPLGHHIVNCFVETLQIVIVGTVVSCTPLVFIPIHGGVDGDTSIREIAFNCRLTYRGARDIASSIVPFYWVLVLPDSMIDSLTQGVPLDATPFPMNQLNPCHTLQTALSKTLHWVRQQVIGEQETLSAIFWKPTIERCIGTLKVRDGTAGQLCWHNCSYISSTYCGIITAEDGVLTLAAQEIANSFAIRLQVTARQAIGGVLQDCFQTGRSTTGVHLLLRMPLAFCDISGVPPLSLLNSHGIEARTYSQHDYIEDAPADSSEPQQVHIAAPRGVEVIVTHR